MALASSSPTKTSLTGSKASLRPNCQAIAAAWQAMCEWRMTPELAFGSPPDLMQSKKFRTFWAAESPPARGVAINSPRSDAGETSIPPASPVSTQPSSPSKRTGQVPRLVRYWGARSPKGVGQEVHHQPDAVGIAGREARGDGSYSTGMVLSAWFAHWQRSTVWAPQSSSVAPESKSKNVRQPPLT